MRFLVTGGSGFIGTNLISLLVKKGYNVLNLDLSPPQCTTQINHYVYCDIREINQLTDLVTNFSPDYIIHLAARTDLLGSCIEDYNSNTLGVENVCIASSQVPNLKKVLFASSMLVCKLGYQPSDCYDFCPSTIYGESKVISEQIVRSYSDVLPDFIIARPTSIWGPWFKEPYRSFFDMVIKRKFIDIGPKMATKTYGFVDNICGQVLSLTTTNEKLKESLIYLGDDVPIDIRKWASDISILSSTSSPLRLPFLVVRAAALFGDALKIIGIKFPLTTFRLNNMTTNNIVDCTIASSINTEDSYSYSQANKITIQWINKANYE